ncbi:hypothetical protein DY000_02048207 [Brassica cretica]|uniref:Uncharacterized protein n=1 Tax=Brassica cretica TaxID=69181 RepID=A0ABQ7F824_BRACR|nr:hypothetical protein DY000_02048207 [Brassica cretica]
MYGMIGANGDSARSPLSSTDCSGTSDSPLSERPSVLLFPGSCIPAVVDPTGSLPGRCDCCGVFSYADVLPSWPPKQPPVIALRILFMGALFLRWESTI